MERHIGISTRADNEEAVRFRAGQAWPRRPDCSRQDANHDRLDDDILDWFKRQVEQAGGGNYQTLINAALREHIKQVQEPLEKTLRRVLREELQRAD